MNWRWEESGGWWMCTDSPHFVRGRQCVGCSAIPRPASCALNGGEKNCVRSLRSSLAPNLRSQAALGARPVGGRHQNLLGDREPSGALPKCVKVKQEKLAWLSDNPFYTKRFAFFVGRRCRTSTIQDVARELRLNWRTAKELDQQYMQEQL